MNRAIVRLLRGEFEQGWAEYEWRWKCEGFITPDCCQPRWQGEPIAGRRIMIFSEQGLGDTFHFIRYAKLLKDRGATVLVWAARPLERMLRLLPYLDGVFPVGSDPPDFDLHVPMLSLPHAFGTTLATIPAGEPYLVADPQLVDRWRDRLAGLGGLKIGISWQGNPKYRGDLRRSMPLGQFAPLARVPGVRLISLQKGFGSEQLAEAGFAVTSLGPDLDEAAGPFMDTAAVLKNLDLVITSDTALAHLAGGLGVPTWVALPFVPDWRWLLDRPDSPLVSNAAAVPPSARRWLAAPLRADGGAARRVDGQTRACRLTAGRRPSEGLRHWGVPRSPAASLRQTTRRAD